MHRSDRGTESGIYASNWRDARDVDFRLADRYIRLTSRMSQSAEILQCRYSRGEPARQVWHYQGVRCSRRNSCWRVFLVVLLLHCPLAALARGETRHVLVL